VREVINDFIIFSNGEIRGYVHPFIKPFNETFMKLMFHLKINPAKED